jgi:type IV pilus assembly protein PilM
MPLPAAFKGLSSLVRAGQSLAAGSGSGAAQSAALGLPVGIDFGIGSLKVLQIAAGDPPTLVAATGVETPDEFRHDHVKRLDFQAQALAAFVRSSPLRNRRAVCAIPAWGTVCKHMQLGKADGLSLGEQVSQQIPLQMNCDPAAVSYRFLDVTPPGAQKTEVIVMAVSRELVSRLMQIVKDAKLEPVGMHSVFLASLAAYDHMHRRTTDQTTNTLYLDIGAGTTSVAISHGKKLHFVRVIDIGGDAIDRAVAEQTGCTVAEARGRRRSGDEPAPSSTATMAQRADARRAIDPKQEPDRRKGAPPQGLTPDVSQLPAAPAPALGPEAEVADMLADEVRMCMRFHSAQFPKHKIDRIIFVGGECRNRGLCQRIATAVKLQSQIADPLSRIARAGSEPVSGIKFDTVQPGWAVVLGLCLAPTDL